MNSLVAMDRRTALKLLLASPLAVAGARARAGSRMPSPTKAGGSHRMPAIFLAHGSPMLLDDAGWVAELAAWAKQLPRPKAILMISAHWLEAPVTIGATRTIPLVYDFMGFPDKYYDVKYPCPGAPDLGRRVAQLLSPTGPVMELPDRGLDHGAYVPLVAMYPAADVPVLQISIPTLDPRELFEIGHLLSPLRDEGVLIIGSGFLTHNMRFAFRKDTPAWAVEFDAWCADVLARRDHDALLDFAKRGPAAQVALPTTEHFVPVIVAAGAAPDPSESVAFPITGFWGQGGGAFTRRSVRFG
jgi:4,5-DOPA dioxygenase extradiol